MGWALCACILYVNTLCTLYFLRNTIVKSSVNTVHIIILINFHACCSSISPFLSIFSYFPVLFFLLYFSFPAFYIVLFCLSMLATVPIQVIHSTATTSSLPLSFVLTICKHVTFFLYSPKTAGPCSSMEFSLFT